MAALPYMPLYVSDYLADTPHLTAAQHGGYMLLLMNYWQTGKPLDDDDEKLRAIAHLSKSQWATAKSILERFFDVENGQWSHKRIEKELARIRALYEKKVVAGKASAEQRASKRSTDIEQVLESPTPDLPMNQHMVNVCSTGVDIIEEIRLEENKEKNTTSNPTDSDFETFWNIYPKRVSKKAARTAFIKAIESVEPGIVIDGATRLAKDPNLPDEQFIPNPTTWLNQARWSDSPYPPRKKTPEERRDVPTPMPPPVDRAAIAAVKAQSVPMPVDFREALKR